MLICLLIAAAAAAPWWFPSVALAMVCTYLLALARTPRWLWLIPAAAGFVGAGVRWFLEPARGSLVFAAAVGAAALLALADGSARAVSARTRYREQGWRLAEALRGREQAAVEMAQAAERGRIAGEMHDSVGHDMALLTMQLSALQVEVQQGGLVGGDLSRRLAELRASAAVATDRLHETIGLLDPASSGPTHRGTGGVGAAARDAAAPAAGPWSLVVADCVGRARAAGLEVDLRQPDRALDDCSPVVGRTVLRIVAEAITNVSKHAPEHPLRIRIEVSDGIVTVSAVNPRSISESAEQAAIGEQSGSRRGLLALTERARLLGGSVRVSDHADAFRLDVSVPTHPVLVTTADASVTEFDHLRTRGRRAVARGRASMLLWPAGVIALGLVIVALAFVVVNVASVLPRERFASIEVGQSQRTVEALLPPLQLPDAPQAIPELTADCRYYEERISFFERVTTFQICFDQQVVASATEIPAERSR